MKNHVLVPIVVIMLGVSWLIWKVSPSYLRQGGPLLVLGLTFLFLVVMFAIERWLVLRRADGRGNAVAFIAALKQSVQVGDVPGAIAACRAQGGSLANVVGAGLEKYRRLNGTARPATPAALEHTRRALQEAAALESPNLEQNLNALSMIASVATMLGLLGTTIGMIRSFHALSRAGAPEATQLALGISEALVNTALGLVTAIIATMLYNHFTTRVDQFNTRLDETSYEVLTLLETGGETAA